MNESSFKILKRVMKTLVNPLNIEGLEIYMTNHTKKIVIDDNYYDVPLLTIRNPKNIPFSYNSLVELVINEFGYISKLSGLDLNNYTLYKLVIFDDFTTGDYYLPDEIYSKLNNCLNTNDKEIKHRMGNTIYTITGRYIVDGDFEMFWDSSESFVVNITFKIKSVFEDNLGNNTHRIITDRDEMIELVYTVSSDDSYVFESPIYNCFSESVSEYITFLDTEWQYCEVHIIAI
jgi:hypothetical protein